MSLMQSITQYGYPFLAAGCLIEGESIAILAGYAAHQGYLSLPWVFMWALLGAKLGDESCFHFGRRWGARVLQRYPHWRAPAVRIKRHFAEHPFIAIVSIRFMYGLRAVGSVAVGMADITSVLFFSYNLLGAMMWVLVYCSLGYALGQSLEWFFTDFKRYEDEAFLALVITLALAFILRHSTQKARV